MSDIPKYLKLHKKRSKLKSQINQLLTNSAVDVLQYYQSEFEKKLKQPDDLELSGKLNLIVDEFKLDLEREIDQNSSRSRTELITLFDDIKAQLDINYPVDYQVLPSAYINDQQIKGEVLRILDEYRSGNITELRMKRLLSFRLSEPAYVATTIARTQIAGFDNEANNAVADMAFLEHFLYFGPTGNSRPFCEERVGKIFTKQQILAMSNGQGLPVQRYCGGYNCLHELIAVDPQWKEVNEYDMAA